MNVVFNIILKLTEALRTEWRWFTKAVSVTQYHLSFVPDSSTTRYQTYNVTPRFLPADHSRTRWYWLRGKKARKCSWLGYSLQLRSGTCLPSARAYRPEYLCKIKRDTSNCKRENLQQSDL